MSTRRSSEPCAKPRRRADGTLNFGVDFSEFRPNLSPAQVFKAGVFGGTYFRPITSGVTGKSYKNAHREFPTSWFRGLDVDAQVASPRCNVQLNRYGVRSGTSLAYWESKGWIKPQDPYGWFQWYCRFYCGRRSADDQRQIDRWSKIAGPNGRFYKRLSNMVENARGKEKENVSPVIRQLLLQWAVDF